ncbi:MAG: AI-2E family transporter [Candidatus Gracilibacteria bacterium]
MPRSKQNLVLHDFARYFFVLAVVGVMILFFWIISPFFNILIYSGLIAVIFYPMYKWFLKHLYGHQSVSALFSTVIVMFIVLVPLALFVVFLAQEAVSTYELATMKWSYMDFKALHWNGLQNLPLVGPIIGRIFDQFGILEVFKNVKIDFVDIAQNLSSGLANFLVAQSTTIVKGVGDTILRVFILLLTMFFFFRDGDGLLSFLKTISPLPASYETEIENKLRDTTYAIVVGNFGTSLVQGAIACIGFMVAGVHNAIFWATLLAFSALIPYIGSALVWFPVSVALLLQGETLWAIFVFCWGLFLVSTVDNVMRPWFIGNRSKMHPLATFLVVLGAIFIFGLKGIIFGPLILSLTVTVLHIYRLEYQDMLES